MTLALERRLRLALAREVSASNQCYVLNRQNELERRDGRLWRTSLENAVSSSRLAGTSYVVDVTERYVVGDIDLPPEQSGPLLRLLEGRLQALGVPHVVLCSGQEGHYHVWCRPSHSLRTTTVSLLRALGVDVRTRIRPPLAPHRNGLEVSPLTASLHELVAFFTDEPGKLIDARSVGPSTGRDYDAIIQGGDPGALYPSRSEMLLACARTLSNRGLTSDQAFTVLSDPVNLGGAKLQSKGKAAEKWWAKHLWPTIAANSAGQSKARRTCPAEVERDAQSLELNGYQMILRSEDDTEARRGLTLTLIARRMRDLGRLMVEVPCRSSWLAHLAGHTVIAEDLNWLSENGHLTRGRPFDPDTRGNLYGAGTPDPIPSSHHPDSDRCTGGVQSPVRSVRQADLMLMTSQSSGRGAGMSYSVLRLLLRARANGLTVLRTSDEFLGGSRASRYRWLKYLSDKGFCKRVGRTYELYELEDTPEDLDDLAFALEEARNPKHTNRVSVRLLAYAIDRQEHRRTVRLFKGKDRRRLTSVA